MRSHENNKKKNEIYCIYVNVEKKLAIETQTLLTDSSPISAYRSCFRS